MNAVRAFPLIPVEYLSGAVSPMELAVVALIVGFVADYGVRAAKLAARSC